MHETAMQDAAMPEHSESVRSTEHEADRLLSQSMKPSGSDGDLRQSPVWYYKMALNYQTHLWRLMRILNTISTVEAKVITA